MQMEIKLLDAESKTQSDEVNEQLERWEEPNVQLEGEIKNWRRGRQREEKERARREKESEKEENWARVHKSRGKKLVILARIQERKRRYLIKRAEALNKQLLF